MRNDLIDKIDLDKMIMSGIDFLIQNDRKNGYMLRIGDNSLDEYIYCTVRAGNDCALAHDKFHEVELPTFYSAMQHLHEKVIELYPESDYVKNYKENK